jgi:DNA-binding response OmpR family regulator
MAATVLVVEDELKLRELLRSHLQRAGYVVLTAASGAEAINLARSATPELMVLDLRLPDVPGEEVALDVRRFSDMAILMLTAKTAQEDRIRGFEAGADDYLTKPFSLRELILRVQAILRRGRGGEVSSTRPSFGEGELVVDEARREVFVRGQLVELTPTEWGLLTSLAQIPGRVYARSELINRVRGYEFEGYERTVDSHIKNLRHKIEDDPRQPRIVLTVLKGGYRLGLARDG